MIEEFCLFLAKTCILSTRRLNLFMAIGSLHQNSERDRDHKTTTWKIWWRPCSWEPALVTQLSEIQISGIPRLEKERKERKKRKFCAGVYKTVYPKGKRYRLLFTGERRLFCHIPHSTKHEEPSTCPTDFHTWPSLCGISFPFLPLSSQKNLVYGWQNRYSSRVGDRKEPEVGRGGGEEQKKKRENKVQIVFDGTKPGSGVSWIYLVTAGLPFVMHI